MNIAFRVKDILFSPKTAWPVIREEQTDVTTLYTQYLMILALIPVVSGFIATSLIGFNLLGQTYRVSLFSGIINMVIGYVLWLLMVYVMALLADVLAPTFNAQKNPMNALKLISYSSTPCMVAGILALLPVPSALISLAAAAYSIYLLFLGIPVVMGASREKALPYTAVLVIGGLLAGVILSLASSLLG